VVDEMGLRSTRLRAVNGDSIRIGNSQITAARVLPSATREVALELFVTDEGEGRDLVERAASMVPTGPTRFVTPPWVSEVEQLDSDLVRIQARASVAHGREWLAESLLPSLISERAPEGLVVHGPVVMHSDQFAASRYARSAARRRTTA